ncbi:MAG TPA: flagellin [Clostridia bacterium]|nr:flagellin [Clostridia bacterium]
MRINNNIMAMNTHRQLGANSLNSSKSMEKLSSGLRINRAADDAAGLSISEKMRGQIRGLGQAQRNAQDGISLVQTFEGALNEVSDMLGRMKELAVQNLNGTYEGNDKANILLEATALASAANNIFTNTKFNGVDMTTGATIAMGQDGGDALVIAGISAPVIGAADLVATIDANIGAVNTIRATYGADQNRLEHMYNNMSATRENLTASESRIRDVDMADEMMKFTKNNILQQAAQAMLAQANQAPQGVLQLLR